MARVTVLPPLDSEFFGGNGEFELDAPSLFALVRQLDGLAPGFGEAAEARAAFALDGAIAADWSAPVAPGSEVLVLLRIAGGRGRAGGTRHG